MLRFDLMCLERVSVGEERRGSFHVEAPKTEKSRGNQQWRVWCEEFGDVCV